ncbi:related to TY3B TY3B protein [Rhynchosporium agropyri]|uniref:Related to TY3B TY3B protein n=1 Tax=Rhynchosporium agropyri TaxID=914238 RepID=A0A1E1K2J4_9HELO|nr:related to TY3B TY3B protein [Rhynchosporium agropyri]
MTNTAFDAIWVITDRLTKYGYFVLYKEGSNAKELAYAFLKIVTDGQTERLNQLMEQYLRSYVNKEQKNWVEMLPLAQFAHNSAKNETTSVSPFFANYGFEPEAYRQPRKDPVSAQESMVLAYKIQDLQKQLWKDIDFANAIIAKYSNQKRSVGPPLKRGDKVYLLRRHIKTKRPSTKLDFKKLGPFEILEEVGPVNFRLRLPQGSRLHPVFHVSLLEPANGDTPLATDEKLQPENEPDEYDVEKLLDTRITTRGQQEYLVKWKGFGDEENSREPTRNLNCPDLLRRFQSRTQVTPRKNYHRNPGRST